MQNRSRVVGLTQIKNKPSRNAFDKTHRHMFTTNFGQILPIFCEWLNPGETIKLGYNGFTRTQPLQTAAFTRLKENVQYFFVPFQSLWKYFEVQVNNMKTGQNGQNVSPFAASLSSSTSVTTGLPYVNYTKLQDLLLKSVTSVVNVLMSQFTASTVKTASYDSMFNAVKQKYTLNGTFRYVLTARLLTSLGYGNFEGFSNFDVIAKLKAFAVAGAPSGWSSNVFLRNTQFGFGAPPTLTNSPNLSVFPLLAYHRIINDFYKYRQWQPIEPWTFNIDYLTPSSSMSIDSLIKDDILYKGTTSLFDMEFSNLPLDYFLGVLPSPQFGEESSVSVIASGMSLNVSGTSSSASFSTGAPSTLKQVGSASASGNGSLSSSGGNLTVSGVNARLENQHTHTMGNAKVQINSGTELGDLRISELRNALALQKYKEIQNANDSDFVSQVLAHFGVKPSTTQMRSRFISGGDSVLQINPEVNSNLVDGSPDIKATVTGQLKCSGSFTADTFGLVIGLYRCTPVLDYAHIGIDRNLFKTDATDFPIPEFDSVGMQTQFACEVAAPSYAAGDSSPKSYSLSRTYGYLPRYAELKTSFDRYEGAFSDSLRSWVSGLTSDKLHDLIYWSAPGTPTSTVEVDMDNILKCTPDLVSNLFENTLNSTSNDDKLLIGSVNTAVIVRPYSVYGLPYSN